MTEAKVTDDILESHPYMQRNQEEVKALVELQHRLEYAVAHLQAMREHVGKLTCSNPIHASAKLDLILSYCGDLQGTLGRNKDRTYWAADLGRVLISAARKNLKS